MKIIISPAKKMKVDVESLASQGTPVYLESAREILSWLHGLSYPDLKKLWSCNDKLAEQNYKRIKVMELEKNLTPALLAYEGIQYQYMAPSLFEYKQLDYVQEHLRILSGFYGVLKPMDGVTPYRLEMQAKAKVSGTKDLYEYWGNRLYQEIRDESGIIINLASKEYSKCIEDYLSEADTYITCVFGEMIHGVMTQKGTYAKMARGEMVRYMAENEIETPEELKSFNRLGYVYREDLSSDTTYVFERVKNNTE